MKIIDFIFAGRPMLLLPVWSLYLISYKYYQGNAAFYPDGLMVLTGLSLLFAGAYYINQIFDYQSDLINKKLGFLQTGKISKTEMIILFAVVSSISLAAAFYINLSLAIIFVLIFFLGLFYSAPPLRFKDRPISGLLANSIAYGMLVPITTVYDKSTSEYLTLILPTYFFLTVSAGYLLTIIPDREGDIQTGKKTLAALMSNKSIIMVAIVLLMLSLFIAWEINYLFLLIISSLSLMLFSAALITPSEKIILFACKFPILLMSLLAGFYYPGYLVFLLALLILTRLYYKKRFDQTYPRIN